MLLRHSLNETPTSHLSYVGLNLAQQEGTWQGNVTGPDEKKTMYIWIYYNVHDEQRCSQTV